MNEITQAVLEYPYKDKNMRKQVFICRRSKNKRIQDKAFNKLFYAFLKEKPVAIIGEVVLLDNKYFLELKRIVNDGVYVNKAYDFLFEGKNNEYNKKYEDYI